MNKDIAKNNMLHAYNVRQEYSLLGHLMQCKTYRQFYTKQNCLLNHNLRKLY